LLLICARQNARVVRLLSERVMSDEYYAVLRLLATKNYSLFLVAKWYNMAKLWLLLLL